MKQEEITRKTGSEIDLFDLAMTVLRKWPLILLSCIVFGVAGFAFKTLTWKRLYKSETVLFIRAVSPDYIKLRYARENSFSRIASVENLISSSFNRILNGKDFVQTIIGLKYNFTLSDGKTFKGDLKKYFGTGNIDTIRKKLKGLVKYNYDKRNSLLIISATTKTPELSAQLANAYAETANKWYRDILNSNARKMLESINKSLKESKEGVEKAEKALLVFLDTNRGLSKIMSGKNNSSAEFQRYEFELTKLKTDVALKRDIYMEFRKKFELLKVEAQKRNPSVVILQKADIPTYPISRGAMKLTLICMFIGAILPILLIYSNYQFKDQKKTIIKAIFLKK